MIFSSFIFKEACRGWLEGATHNSQDGFNLRVELLSFPACIKAIAAAAKRISKENNAGGNALHKPLKKGGRIFLSFLPRIKTHFALVVVVRAHFAVMKHRALVYAQKVLIIMWALLAHCFFTAIMGGGREIPLASFAVALIGQWVQK